VKRILTAVGAIGSVFGLAYFVLTHPSVDKRERLQRTVRDLNRQNKELAEENNALREEIHQLKTNPQAAVKRARQFGGLARENEVIYHFRDVSESPAIKADIKVTPKTVNFEGKEIGVDQLGGEITEFQELVAGLILTVRFEPQVGQIRRQRIRDIVNKLSIEEVEFTEISPEQPKDK
jgi:cell division protein FtsB